MNTSVLPLRISESKILHVASSTLTGSFHKVGLVAHRTSKKNALGTASVRSRQLFRSGLAKLSALLKEMSNT